MHSFSMSALSRLFVVVPALLLPSCVLRNPLSDPDQSKPDERLLGAWKIVDGDLDKYLKPGSYGFIFIGKAEYVNAPTGLMTVVSVSNKPDHKIEAWRAVDFFPTRVGGSSYANCLEDEPRSADRPVKWDKARVKGYTLMKYTVERDKLTVCMMDRDAVEKAVRSGRVKGTIEEHWLFNGVALDGGPDLLPFLTREGDKLLFPDIKTMVFERAK